MTGGGMEGKDAPMGMTRTLEFAAEDGLAVTVTVRSPAGKAAGGMRLAAIRSALVNHASLYPIGGDGPEGAPPPLGKPRYGRLALVGMAIPLSVAALFAALVWSGDLKAPDGGPAVSEAMGRWMLTALLPSAMALCALLFVSMEWTTRRYARTAHALRAERGLPAQGSVP